MLDCTQVGTETKLARFPDLQFLRDGVNVSLQEGLPQLSHGVQKADGSHVLQLRGVLIALGDQDCQCGLPTLREDVKPLGRINNPADPG